MEVTEFLSIGIVGVFVSVIIELITVKLSTRPIWSKAVTIIVSLAFAGLYVWVRNTSFFPTVVTVLGVASTVYALFIKK